MTTAESISFAQIEGLRAEALTAGDYAMAAICDLALGGEIDMDDYTCVDRRDADRIGSMSRDEAYAECASAIDEARAMAD